MRKKSVDRINIEKKDRKDIYDELLKNRSSTLYGKENRVPYILALTIGFLKGEKLKLNKKEGFIRIDTLLEDDKTLIKAIAVKDEGDLDVLLDKEKVFRIADEYANFGIKFLHNSVLGKEYGTYTKKLEIDLLEKFNEIKKNLQNI